MRVFVQLRVCVCVCVCVQLRVCVCECRFLCGCMGVCVWVWVLVCVCVCRCLCGCMGVGACVCGCGCARNESTFLSQSFFSSVKRNLGLLCAEKKLSKFFNKDFVSFFCCPDKPHFFLFSFLNRQKIFQRLLFIWLLGQVGVASI